MTEPATPLPMLTVIQPLNGRLQATHDGVSVAIFFDAELGQKIIEAYHAHRSYLLMQPSNREAVAHFTSEFFRVQDERDALSRQLAEAMAALRHVRELLTERHGYFEHGELVSTIDAALGGKEQA